MNLLLDNFVDYYLFPVAIGFISLALIMCVGLVLFVLYMEGFRTILATILAVVVSYFIGDYIIQDWKDNGMEVKQDRKE